MGTQHSFSWSLDTAVEKSNSLSKKRKAKFEKFKNIFNDKVNKLNAKRAAAEQAARVVNTPVIQPPAQSSTNNIVIPVNSPAQSVAQSKPAPVTLHQAMVEHLQHDRRVDYEIMKALLVQEHERVIIPQIAESFTALGGGRSSSAQNAIKAANDQLESKLAALRKNLGL